MNVTDDLRFEVFVLKIKTISVSCRVYTWYESTGARDKAYGCKKLPLPKQKKNKKIVALKNELTLRSPI